jgi:hypothetical protein
MTEEVALEGRGLIKRLNIDILRELIPDAGMDCMACDSHAGKSDIHAHHINLDSTDDRLRNISFICRPCHHAAHTTSDKGWRRSVYPIKSSRIHKTSKLTRSWEERFETRFSHLGGIEGFKKLYLDAGLSLSDVGIKYGCVRERIRQYAVRLGLPPRGKGYMDGGKTRKHGFPYRHKPLSDYLYNNNISPAQFAEMLNKSYAWINALLNMSRPISASMAIEIINATNGSLTIEQLMNPLVDHRKAPAA